MSTVASSAIAPDTQEHQDKRNDVHDRFLLAAIADPALFADVPKGMLLCLLPDDDPAFIERELIVGADAVRRGRDAYFRHIRVADLPEPPPRPGGRTPGQRRTFFNWDGSIDRQEVAGPDGEWHPVEPEPHDPLD